MINESDLEQLLEGEQQASSPRPEYDFQTLGARARQRLEEHNKTLAEEEKIRLAPGRRSSELAGMISPKRITAPPSVTRGFSPIQRSGSGSRPNSCPGSRATTPEICGTDSDEEEENIRIECYELGDLNASAGNSTNESIASLTKLPKDFPLMQEEYSKKHGPWVLFSLRLGDGSRVTRRISLALLDDDRIELSDAPKPSKVKSKTQPENSPFSGHILADPNLCHPEREYNLKDNCTSGSFPLALSQRIDLSGVNAFTKEEMDAYRQIAQCDDVDNQKVIDKFVKQIKEVCKDPAIVKAYLYHGLVVYNKIVSYQDKKMPGQPFDITHVKHFIEEARSLGYVISRIYEGHFQLVAYHEKALTFTFENKGKTITAKLDLTLGVVENLEKVKLEPPADPQSLEIFAQQTQEEIAQQLVNYYENYLFCHFPLWYIPPGEQEYAPAMVIASDNGLPYAGDMDPEHISMRSDMPWEATISFNGRNGETEDSKDAIPLFMLGMLILDQRLRAQDTKQYANFITELLISLESQNISRERARSNEIVNLEHLTSEEKLELAKNYLKQFKTTYSALFIKQYLLDIQAQLTEMNDSNRPLYTYHDNSQYYSKEYLPTLAAAFRNYQLNPAVLLTIGQSRVHDAVINYDIDHSMVQHGSEEINPGIKVPRKGKVMQYFDNPLCTTNGRNFVVTRNEISYLAFLFHEPMFLKKANFDVHPSQIVQDTNPNYLLWRTLIKIQALFRARHDAKYGTTFADNFRRILQENYRFREQDAEYVKQAQIALKQIFAEVDALVAQMPIDDSMSIEEYFNMIIDAEYNSDHIKKLTTIVRRQLGVFMLPKAAMHEEEFQGSRSLLHRFHTASSSSPHVISSDQVNSRLLEMFNSELKSMRHPTEDGSSRQQGHERAAPPEFGPRHTLSKL